MEAAGFRVSFIVCVGLAALAAAIYGQTLNAGFVNYDDDLFVTANAPVQAGLTPDSLRWALGPDSFRRATVWYPLTWVSLELDAQSFGRPRAGSSGRGPAAFGFHLTNLVLFALNAALLFLALSRMTHETWKAAAVACLFCAHPLNVETAAWVSERKGLLSMMCFLAMLLAYVWYERKPHWVRFGLVLALLGLGLAAKPILIVAPFLLLLLDYWPFGRISLEASAWGRQNVLPIAEKALLLIPCGLCAAINLSRGGTPTGLYAALPRPFWARLANALESCAGYLQKLVYPARLSPDYGQLGDQFDWRIPAIAAVILIALTALALRQAERRPYLTMGWLWFMGALVPVIGLVPIGHHGMADRYAYLPMIGPLVACVWLAAEIADRFRVSSGARLIVASTVCTLLATMSFVQAGYWQNSFTLWEHAVKVSPTGTAHNKLGEALLERGDNRRALAEFERAVRLDSELGAAHFHLGTLLLGVDPDRALHELQQARRQAPYNADVPYAVGLACAQKGDAKEAIRWYEEAIRLDPGHARAHNNLGLVYQFQGDCDRAIEHFRAALASDPGYTNARQNLDAALAGNRG